MNRMVGGQILSSPELLRGPILRRTAPELILRGQSEREEPDGTEIETPGGDVPFADARLVPAESDRQPALRIECPRRLDHAPDHGRQGAADLCVCYSLGELVHQRHLSQQLKG